MSQPTVDVGSPPPAAGAGASTYLGVPDNYVYNPPGNVVSTAPDPVSQILGFTAQTAMQPPRYKTGDEMSIASMPPETIARLQSELATAGLIGPSTVVHSGLADSATVSAFKALLSFANVNGVDWQSAISQLAANPPVKAVQPVELPNPISEDNALYSAAHTLLGRDPTQQQLDGFRPYYDALVKQSTAQANSNDSTVVAPPAVSDAAEGFLRQNAGIQVQGEQMSGVMNALDSLIAGTGEPNFGQEGH